MCLRAVDEWQGLGLPHGAAALLLVDGRRAGRGRRGGARHPSPRHMADAGALAVEQAHRPDEVDRLFLARRLAYPALERLGPVLTEDICVPRAAVPEMLARIRDTAAAHDVVIATIAHAGDGNLHPLIIAPEGDDAAKARAKLAFDRIVEDCRALGGTVTGEHGVGLLKLPGARAELGERVLAMHRDIKAALDPRGHAQPRQGLLTRTRRASEASSSSPSLNAFGCSMLVAWPAFSITADCRERGEGCRCGRVLARPELALAPGDEQHRHRASPRSPGASRASRGRSAARARPAVKPAFAALRSIAFSSRAMRTGPFDASECRPGSGMPVAK